MLIELINLNCKIKFNSGWMQLNVTLYYGQTDNVTIEILKERLIDTLYLSQAEMLNIKYYCNQAPHKFFSAEIPHENIKLEKSHFHSCGLFSDIIYKSPKGTFYIDAPCFRKFSADHYINAIQHNQQIEEKKFLLRNASFILHKNFKQLQKSYAFNSTYAFYIDMKNLKMYDGTNNLAELWMYEDEMRSLIKKINSIDWKFRTYVNYLIDENLQPEAVQLVQRAYARQEKFSSLKKYPEDLAFSF